MFWITFLPDRVLIALMFYVTETNVKQQLKVHSSADSSDECIRELELSRDGVGLGAVYSNENVKPLGISVLKARLCLVL